MGQLQCLIPTHIPTVYPRTVFVLWDSLCWQLNIWTYLLTCCVQPFTTYCWLLLCCAVMLKAKMPGTALDFCRCVREGKYIGGFARSEKLKPYSNQLTPSTVSRTIISSAVSCFWCSCRAFGTWKNMSIYFGSCICYNIRVNSCGLFIGEEE